MKRDMELIRKIVLAIEESPGGYGPPNLIIEGYTGEQISYHAYLMIQAGLAMGRDTTHMDSTAPEAMLLSLTWDGHEFADASREESRWKKAMGMISEKSGSVTVTVLTQLLTAIMKGTLGLS